MYLTDNEYTLVFDEVLMHLRSQKEIPLMFRALPGNPKLCALSMLKHGDISMTEAAFKYQIIAFI